MTAENYTDRHLKDLVVSELDVGKDGFVSVYCNGVGFGYVADPEKPMLVIGDAFELETRGASQVTGIRLNGEWIMRKSDEDLAREHEAFRASWKEKQRRTLEANREAWTTRESVLPKWIKDRLDTFHERGGEVFELEGWGYELCIAELAVLYRESDGEESPSVKEYDALHGLSGHQHATARLLAKVAGDDSLAGTVAALRPLGAHPFYEVAS